MKNRAYIMTILRYLAGYQKENTDTVKIGRYSVKEVTGLLEKKECANLGFYPTPFYKLDRLSDKLGKEHIQRLEAEGHKCYDIPMGGATALFAEKEILGEII